ncbi:hypothetical protein Tco_0345731 [Tanacetum coccineum]
MVSNVGEHVVATVSEHLDFMPCGATTLTKHVVEIIIVNVIPPDHVDDVPVVEPNQHDDVPIVPEPIIEDEDKDPEEEEIEKEEDPQEEDDDREVDIEEDKDEPELTYPYEEMESLNPLPPASDSEPDDEIEVEDAVEPEIKTIPVSVYEVGESSTAAIPQEDGDSLLPGFMRRLCGCETAHALAETKGKAKDKFYGKLILDLGNEMRSSVEQETAAMERLVEKLGNVEDKNERVERDLYWTRVRAHDFYQEMIRRGFVFKERPNEAINVPIEDENSRLSESRGSPHDA